MLRAASCLVLFLGSSAVATAGELYPFPRLALPAKPVAFASGDFDGDARPELVALVNSRARVAVFANLGDGTFAAPTLVNLGTSVVMQAVAVGDFDGDGDRDLAALGGGLRIALAGDGHGGFAAPVSAAVANVDIRDCEVGDVNGDGRDDVVVVWNSAPMNAMEVTLGAASAALFAGGSSHLLFADARSVAVGDVTGDGIDDVVTSARASIHPFGVLDVFAFSPAFMQHHGSTDFDFTDLALADFDKDGKLDLAGASTGTNVTVMQGKGVFVPGQPAFAPSLALSFSANRIAIGDFDGDLRPDVVGGFTTQGAGLRGVMNPGPVPLQAAFISAAPVGMSRILTADLDGDGDDDVVDLNTADWTLDVLTSNQGHVGPHEIAFGALDVQNLLVADLDADGRTDVLTLSTPAGFTSFEAQVDGALGPPVTIPMSGLSVPTGGAIADFNADGLIDLYANDGPTHQCGVRSGVADGSFTPTALFVSNTNTSLPVAGDLDLDGDVDILEVGYGQVSVKRGSGDGVLTEEVPIVLGPFTDRRDAKLVDVDLDGVLDVAYSGGVSHNYTVARGTGTAAGQSPFYPATTLAAIVPALPFATADTAGIDVTDVDDDGWPDIVGSQFDYGQSSVGFGPTVSWYRGLGGGAFTPAGSFALAPGPGGGQTSALRLADVDGDGHDDAIVARPNSAGVAILRGNGFGFQPVQHYTLGANSWQIALGDLNLDGLPDLVGHSGTNVLTSLHLPGAPHAPSIAALYPAQCPAVGGVVTISGSGLSNVTQLQLGAMTFGASDFTLLGDEQIQLAPPIPVALGPVSLVAHAATGSSNAATLTFVATDPPGLVVSPHVKTAAILRFEWGHLPGKVPFLVANASAATFSFNGLTLLDPIVFLPLPRLDAVGAGSISMPAAIVPALVPIDVQFWTVAPPGDDPGTLAASTIRTFTVVP